MTNRQKLANMTNEQLACYIVRQIDCCCDCVLEHVSGKRQKCNPKTFGCCTCVAAWLEVEVQEDA